MDKFTEAVNPATGEIIGEYPLNDVEDLKAMINEGRKIQKVWEAVSVNERSKIVIKIKKFLVDNADRIAETISNDNGKTRIDALATEVLSAAMAISYYCKNANKFLKAERIKGVNPLLVNKRSKLIKVPYGVVGIISPWNYPFGIPFHVIILALLSGNAVILKVASETQPVGAILQEAINFANLPEGVFNYINLPGRIAGDALLENGIDKLFFTGSVEVGKYLMKKASETLTPVSLELGGNDPMIVCEDADPYRAAKGALWAGFQNAGQSCGGVERIYVHENIYDDFMNLLKQNVSSLRVGKDDNFEIDMGCMTTTKQKQTVEKHISEALEKGAKIFAQSQIPEDLADKNFLPAIVLTEVNHEMLVMREETFGPVVGVMKFKTYDEAIRLANDSNLGLSASVWTKNQKLGFKIASQIRAGAILINDHLMSHGLAETPWGGFKESGIGRTHGKYGFEEMIQPVVIVKDVLPFVKKNLWWHPYNKKVYDSIKGILNLLYAEGLSKRFKAAVNILTALPRMFRKD